MESDYMAECQALRQWESETLSRRRHVTATERLVFQVHDDSALRYRVLPGPADSEKLGLAEAVFAMMWQRHKKQLKLRDATKLEAFRDKLLEAAAALNGNAEDTGSSSSSEVAEAQNGQHRLHNGDQQDDTSTSESQDGPGSAESAVAFHRLFGLNIRVHPSNEVYRTILVFGNCENGKATIDIGHVYGQIYVPLGEAASKESVESELRTPSSRLSSVVERIAAQIQSDQQRRSRSTSASPPKAAISGSGDGGSASAAAAVLAPDAASLAQARASELNRILDMFEGVQQMDESCEPPAEADSVNAEFKRCLTADPVRYRLCTVEAVRSSSGKLVGVPVQQEVDGLRRVQLINPSNWLPGEQVLVELNEQASAAPVGSPKGRILGYYKRRQRYHFLSREQLQRCLAEQPERFKVCCLELDGGQGGWAVPVNPEEAIPRVKLNGRENCGRACANDQVVVEVMGTDPATGEYKGRVVGVHKQAEKLRYQLFLCEVLNNLGALMRPLCGTFPKISYDNSIAHRDLKEEVDRQLEGSDERGSNGQRQVTHNRDRALQIDRDFVSVFTPRKNSAGKIFFEPNRAQRVNKEFCEQTFLVCFEFWHLDKSYPMGKVVYVLDGTDGSLAEAFGLIQMRHRLPRPLRETAEVRKQVASVVRQAAEMRIKGRVDYRQVPTVTIDNPDTRDMDDAISYQRCQKTGVETVGVHITDVCEFIGTAGSRLDRLARGRLRTIYPPKVAKSQMQQQVTPNHMLPRTLAEEALSLREGVDRPCLSVMFKFKREKQRGLVWERPVFQQTVIRSNLRLNKIDVQPVLLDPDRSADSYGDRLTADFVSMLRSLWDIARLLRLKRLGQAGFQLQDDDSFEDDDEQGSIGRTFETACLIEELMVLANLSVGQWLAEHQRPAVAIVQDVPRRSEVDRWLCSYRQLLVHMPRLQRDLRGLRRPFDLCDFPLSMSRADYDFIMKYHNGKPRDCMLRLMHDSRHPHMMLALSEWFSISQPAHYDPMGEVERPPYHFSLQQANYVHFTSPMRRYADIVVHRAFRAVIANQQQGAASGETADSLRELCDSLRTLERRAKLFDKDSVGYAYASRLKWRPQQELVVVRSIDEGEVAFTSSRLRRMPRTLGTVKMSSFGLDARPKECVPGTGKFRCRWSRRIFVHPSCEDAKRYVTNVQHYLGSEVRVKRDVYVRRVNCRPVVQLREVFIESGANYESVRGQFRRLQDVVQEDRGTWMVTCENDLMTGGPNQQLLVSGNPVQFYREFAVGDIMRLQFRAQLRQGLLTPCVALIEVCQSHTVCVTHKDDPVRCFAEVTDEKSKPTYRDINEYATIWQRIVAIESSTIAARADDSVTLHEVALDWTYHQPSDRWLGAFHLPAEFCIQRQIKVGADATALDPQLESKIGDLEFQRGRGGGSSLSEEALNEAFQLAGERARYSDFLCLRFPGDSSKAAGSEGYFTAVAHGGILLVYQTAHGRTVKCSRTRDDGPTSYACQLVVFALQQHDKGPRFDWSGVPAATVEVLQKFLPIRRQELALWRLPSMPGTSLAHKIALLGSRDSRSEDISYGQKLQQKQVKSYSIETGTEQRYNEHTGESYTIRKRIPCNEAQNMAITEAMKYDLTLIWGPPGTGKTSTGVMLTYWYAFVNRCFDEGRQLPGDSDDQSDDDDDFDDQDGKVAEDEGAEAVAIDYAAFSGTSKEEKVGDQNGTDEWGGTGEALRRSLDEEAEWSTVGPKGRSTKRSKRSSGSLISEAMPAAPLRSKRFTSQMTARENELQTRRQVLYCGPSNRSVDVVAEYLKLKLGDQKCPAIVRVFSEQLEQKKYPVPGDGASKSGASMAQGAGDGDITPMMQEIALHELIRDKQRNPESADILQAYDALFRRFLEEEQHTQQAWRRSLGLTVQSDAKFCAYLQRMALEILGNQRSRGPNVSANFTYLDLTLLNLVTMYRKVVATAKKRVLQQFEVVLCTTSVSCSSVLQTACKFSQIIIDEAGMCTEPETLVPLVDCSTIIAAATERKPASHFAERLVLIGDHKQLRPIIENRTAEQLGLGVSLFERHSHRAVMLSYQYRMHPSLSEFSADYFYRTSQAHLQTRQSPSWTGLQLGDDVRSNIDENKKLLWNGINTHRYAKDHAYDSYNFRTEGHVSGKQRLENVNVLIGCWPGVRRQSDCVSEDGRSHGPYSSHRIVKPHDLHLRGEEDRIVFLHVEGIEEKVTVTTDEGSEDSRRNLAEIDEVVRIYKEIRRRAERPRIFSDSLAVLSQYRYQVSSIAERLRTEVKVRSPIVKTVIASQGSEFDYVILSLVRSLPNFEIPKFPLPSWENKYLGFIIDANQINVALTRARRGLIIIGNRHLLQANPMWSALLSNLHSRGCVVDNPTAFPGSTGDKRHFTRDGSDPKLSGRGGGGGGGGGSGRPWGGGGRPWNSGSYRQQQNWQQNQQQNWQQNQPQNWQQNQPQSQQQIQPQNQQQNWQQIQPQNRQQNGQQNQPQNQPQNQQQNHPQNQVSEQPSWQQQRRKNPQSRAQQRQQPQVEFVATEEDFPALPVSLKK